MSLTTADLAVAWQHLEPLAGAAIGSALVTWRKLRGWDSAALARVASAVDECNRRVERVERFLQIPPFKPTVIR